MNKAEKISHGNLETWKKKREEFFKTGPKCAECKEPLKLYTRTGKCAKCRALLHSTNFNNKHQDYHKKYNKIRDKKRWEEEKLKKENS